MLSYWSKLISTDPVNKAWEHSGSVVECLTQDWGAAVLSLTGVTGLCPWVRNINPSLVLVQPRKTGSYITERLLMWRKESNQTDSAQSVYWCVYTHAKLSSQLPGRVGQSVTCLATDASLTADPGVASSIPVRSHTFVEIDHEIISTVILLLPLNHSRRVVVSYKRKYVHEVLVNCLFKLAQEKVWLGELTVPQWP